MTLQQANFGIIQIVGITALILSGLAGLTLLFRAMLGREMASSGTTTLWGLLVLGLALGLWIMFGFPNITHR